MYYRFFRGMFGVLIVSLVILNIGGFLMEAFRFPGFFGRHFYYCYDGFFTYRINALDMPYGLFANFALLLVHGMATLFFGLFEARAGVPTGGRWWAPRAGYYDFALPNNHLKVLGINMVFSVCLLFFFGWARSSGF